MSFAGLTDKLVELVDTAILPLLYAFAFLFFLIGMVRFFFLGGDEGREKGKQFMLWSIVGLAVLFSVWGLVRLFLSILPTA